MPLPYQWQMRVDRLKNMFGGMFGKGERRPQLCPACGALVGITATRCHQCGTSLRFGLAAWSKGLSEFFGGQAPVTTAILILNVIMFGVSLIRSMKSGGGFGLFGGMSGVELYRLGENVPLRWGVATWWRLITGTFLHGGLLHIGMNMMVLLDIAPMVEEVYGSARFLFIVRRMRRGWLPSEHTLWQRSLRRGERRHIRLIGVLIAVTSKRGGASMQAMRSRLISWVVTIFAFGFLVPGIDNWGHFGGLTIGFFIGQIFLIVSPQPARSVPAPTDGMVCRSSHRCGVCHDVHPLQRPDSLITL